MLCGALGIGPAQLMGLPRGRVRLMGCLAALFDQCRSLDGLCGRERCLHALRDLFLKIQETRRMQLCQYRSDR